MNYEQFIDAMLSYVSRKMVNVAAVEKQEILRNNGVKAIGLSIRRQGENAAPIIYLEEYYQKYCLGADLELLAGHLIQKSNESVPAPLWQYENILDFRKIKGQIIYKLINAGRNRELLQKVPHLPIFDLAIVFQILIPTEETDRCSILVRNAHMDYWKIPISVLYQYAQENTPRLCPYRIRPLSDYVETCMEEELPDCPLYILSNEMETNGAATILYPKLPQTLYNYFGRNYYLLPSSIHEFLLLPESLHAKAMDLQGIVQNVNENHVEEEEFLADSVYYFNGKNITKM